MDISGATTGIFESLKSSIDDLSAALRDGNAGTNVNASTTVNDARQNKTTQVMGPPISDTSAAGALANAN